MKRPLAVLAGLLLGTASAGAGAAQGLGAAPSAFDAEAAIAYSQAAIGRGLGDFAFRDRDGAPVRLSAFLGRPLVVNMVFTGCNESCPLIVQSLYRAVAVAQDTLGRDSFTVVTIGFDSEADTPERMRAYARTQGVDLPRWDFLSGDAETVARLAETLGFIYHPSPRGFDHLAQTTVIDGEGRVYRQVYGSSFDSPALVEPLMALALGGEREIARLSDIIDRVRLFCTFYDAASDRYRFDYSLFIGLVIGGASLAGIGVVLVRAWLRSAPPAGRA
jgi:protein SCO1/2